MSWTDTRLFWRQFREQFRSTGALLPSGRQLARSLCHYLKQPSSPRRVLEVGPGTGAVTAEIVRHLGPSDQLDLVELNEHFVQRLHERFATEPSFRAVSDRTRILHQPVESLAYSGSYDLIISGLPLNNFAAADVKHILSVLMELLGNQGRLSFFEYIGIRHFRTRVGSKSERLRMQGISEAIHQLLESHEIRRDWVWPNLPPAWVHHICISRETAPAEQS